MSDKVPASNTPPQLERSGHSNAEVAKMISDAVAEALKIAIPAAAVGIAQANRQSGENDRAALIKAVQRRTERCPICLVPKAACGGPWKLDKDGNEIIERDEQGAPKYSPEVNHIRYFCGPKDSDLFKWFQGVMLGTTAGMVRFLADYPGHLQWIPKKSDIPTTISHWEKNEKELSQRRQAEGQGAGRLAPGGPIPGNQQAIGWR